MTNSITKQLSPFLAIGALILVVGFILYMAGFRLTTATPPTAAQRQDHIPGQHQRRQALGEEAAGQPGAPGSVAGQQGRHASRRSLNGSGGQAELRTGTLGTEKIAVLGKGGEQSFTGADIEHLQKTTIVSRRGAREGWRLADVLNHLTITQGNEVILETKDGKTLNLPWEKVASHEPSLLLVYNSFGGLMLISGKEITPEELQTMKNRDTKEMAKQYHSGDVYFSQINKIEVKG